MIYKINIMASFIKKCEICHKEFNYTCGSFTLHLFTEHNISLKDYTIKYELKGITPKCACGYCNEEPPFIRGKFLTHIGEHKTYKWMHEHYIKEYGMPKCKTCGKEIGFARLLPQQYCSHKCQPNYWNQEQCRKTLKEHYGVDNPMYLQSSKNSISLKNKASALQSKIKRKQTCREKYGVDSVMHLQSSVDKQKEVMLKKYGVNHISKTEKFKKDASQRAKDKNPAFNEKNIRTHKYKNTNLTYQSSYEYNFLELCENKHILHKFDNGHNFKYNEGHNMRTDFSIDNYEIEIKSSWVLKRQGGLSVLFAKKEAVENTGKKYIFILDKDYSEFLSLNI